VTSHGLGSTQRFLFNIFAFLHQLKQFPRAASLLAAVFVLWHSNRVAESQILANLHLNVVYHFNRLTFLHQSRQFRIAASISATGLGICPLHRAAEFRDLVSVRLWNALWNQYVFLLQLTKSAATVSLDVGGFRM
jgi:hypothetical protein